MGPTITSTYLRQELSVPTPCVQFDAVVDAGHEPCELYLTHAVDEQLGHPRSLTVTIEVDPPATAGDDGE